MGREAVTLTATATVSKHNSPQDDEDAAQWNLFVVRVRRLAEKSKLDIDISGEELTVQGW